MGFDEYVDYDDEPDPPDQLPEMDLEAAVACLRHVHKTVDETRQEHNGEDRLLPERPQGGAGAGAGGRDGRVTDTDRLIADCRDWEMHLRSRAQEAELSERDPLLGSPAAALRIRADMLDRFAAELARLQTKIAELQRDKARLREEVAELGADRDRVEALDKVRLACGHLHIWENTSDVNLPTLCVRITSPDPQRPVVGSDLRSALDALREVTEGG